MTGLDQSIPADYFDAKYRADRDPWAYATSSYEAAKYAASLAALPRTRYRAALEIGCSIGVFTARLAPCCDHLLAIDAAPTALQLAAARCRDLSQVRFRPARVPEDFPCGPFDLIVIAEVGYYLTVRELARTRDACARELTAGGHLLLVHWTPPIDDALLPGDTVHDAFLHDGRFQELASRREEVYRLDLLERVRN
jgi:SAM-dependent methyltransferase